MDPQQQPQQNQQQICPLPFWSSVSQQISQQLWSPSSSRNADEWGLEPIASGWGTCHRWSSDAVVHDNFNWLVDHAGRANCEERRAKRLKAEEKLPKNDKKGPAQKAKKIRLYPTAGQKDILVKWIGAAPWTYNECLRAITDEGVPKLKKALRARAINRDAVEMLQKPWLVETPYDIRDAAMGDLLKAFESGAARYKKDKMPFKIQYRSRRKCFQESIVIHSKHWARGSGKYAFLRQIKSAEKLPEKLSYDSRLVMERSTGHFYLCVPAPLEMVEGPTGVPRVMSLDPGVRSFMTGYSPDGEMVELGKGDIGRIYRLCHWLDDLQSRWSVKGLDHRKKWRMKRAGARIRQRIRNLVNDLHCRIAKYLCSSINLIIMPTFPTQQMVRRGRRRIRSKTARAMATWAHYRFQQRLLDKAREYGWCQVVLVSEAHTSKTCGACGRLNNIGGSKVFKCSHCGLVCDRDANGARNILVRYCTKVLAGESVTD
ncbi:putative transposase DNA-binding domain-containing protein [Lipomyces tetrasporus]|uniref:Transposase DNA-binding domain-containing protein n=1 Tax=Lipomyces tetrasporus TaxID=54092 RepID=A0AAD7VW09_9ASCO|nr:putative transposase DNA-binding domain-containing protein [Lipomyces tetrasporus]KAJ8104093.1 putative transposase DNA-binding domain-containing protein [Lipomyces tetrasporus]